MPNNSDSTSAKLTEFLNTKLLGSTAEVFRRSPKEVQLKAGDDITMNIVIDVPKKKISFNLFSPSLNRPIVFEEVQGTSILDVRLGDELKSANHESEEQDAMLAIDLLREWSRDNKYDLSHV